MNNYILNFYILLLETLKTDELAFYHLSQSFFYYMRESATDRNIPEMMQRLDNTMSVILGEYDLNKKDKFGTNSFPSYNKQDLQEILEEFIGIYKSSEFTNKQVDNLNTNIISFLERYNILYLYN